MLEKAMRDYPARTHVKWADADQILNGIYHFGEDGRIIDSDGNCVFNTSKWAEIVEKKEPLLVSEDGKSLFYGDDFYIVGQDCNGKFQLEAIEPDMYTFKVGNSTTFSIDTEKYFSTKEAAEAWILEQNKPKEIEVKLFGDDLLKAVVTTQSIIFKSRKNSDVGVESLTPSDIEDISHALKKLSC